MNISNNSTRNPAKQSAFTALGLMHPNPIVVAARGPRSLPVLRKVLMETKTEKRDVVVITCKVLPPRTQGVTEEERSLDETDRELLTRIVTVAEEVGRTGASAGVTDQ